MNEESNDEQLVSAGSLASMGMRYQSVYNPMDMLCVCTGQIYMDIEEVHLVPDEQLWWGRFYNSGWCHQDGPLGPCFRHRFQCTLERHPEFLIFREYDGAMMLFPCDPDGNSECEHFGFLVETLSAGGYEVRNDNRGVSYLFEQEERGLVLVRMQSAGDRTIALSYDRQGLLREIEFENPKTQLFLDYNERGRIVALSRSQWGQERERLLSYGYDDQGLLTSYDSPYDSRYEYSYEEQRMTLGVTPRGFRYQWRFDNEGRCVEALTDDDQHAFKAVYYDGLTEFTPKGGGQWSYRYNEDLVLTSIEDPCGGLRRFECNKHGLVEAEINRAGQRTTWLFDPNGHHLCRVDHFGALLPPAIEDLHPSTGRELKGPESMQEANFGKYLDGGGEEVMSVDLLRKQLPIGLQGHLERVLHEDRPQPKSRIPSFRFNRAGDVIHSVDSQGHETHYEYGPQGNLVATVDEQGFRTSKKMISWGIVGEVEDPMGGTCRYRYASGYLDHEIASCEDANGHRKDYRRDEVGRILEVHSGGELEERYERDSAGRILRTFDGDNRLLLSYAYGENGESSSRTQSSGDVHEYEYNDRGMITNASTRGQQVRIRYDDDRNVCSDKRNGIGVEHSLDEEGVKWTVFDRFATIYRDDEGGRGIECPEGSYCRLNRYTRSTVLRSFGDGFQELTHFDELERCAGRMLWKEDSSDIALWNARYLYSPAGNLDRIEDSQHGRTNLAYDACHRILHMENELTGERSYRYDAAGNLLANPYYEKMAVDRRSQLVRADNESFRFDRRYRLRERLVSSGHVSYRTSYRYNDADRLVAVEFEDGREAWTSAYDGLGRQMWSSIGEARSEYYWDDERIAARVSPQGQLRIFIYAQDHAMVPLMFVDYASTSAAADSGKLYHVISDQIGMPRLILDKVGEVVWSVERADAYGELKVWDPYELDYELRWPGKLWHPHPGIQTARFRTYEPRLGRYLQLNPKGQSGGMLAYGYRGNPQATLDVHGI